MTGDCDGDEQGEGTLPPGDADKPALAERRNTEQVYQPAEDSRLLAETAVDHVGADALVLDVGTGSGYVADRVATETGARVAGSDLNPHACRRASAAGLAVVRADLTTAFRDGAFDVVLFNPPYLPTGPDEGWGDWMDTALSGGPDGRSVVEPFLSDLRRVLAPRGRALVLVSTLTDPDAVRASATANGLATRRVASDSYPFEQLLVLELRPGNN
jgi:release factor glutamine methyltransferase